MASEARADAEFGGVSQEDFLAEIRRRMDRSKPPGEHPGSQAWPEGIEETVSFAKKVETFAKQLEAIGGKVLTASSLPDAYARAKEILSERGIHRILLGKGDWSAAGDVLLDGGLQADRWDEISFRHGTEDRNPERANAWGAGITWVDYAVANLGSVAICSSPDQGRSVSLVPPLFIALVAPDRLFYTRRAVLEDVARLHREGKGPSSLTFITGPSRSADIENDLTIGVHGPGEVFAVVVEGS